MSTEPLALPASLDVAAAGPLVQALLAQRGRAVSLDASAVRRLGGQCLQVLLSAEATWAADGQAFAIVDPSPEFADGAALMGASRLAQPSELQD